MRPTTGWATWRGTSCAKADGLGPGSRIAGLALLAVCLVAGPGPPLPAHGQARPPEAPRGYLGFDRNLYPGDEALAILRKTFSFASYWLGAPPGEKTNTWAGKRELLKKNGFGFAVLYRGREERELRGARDAGALGDADGQATVLAAGREGFGPQTILYLDIEEGGRLSPLYHAYIARWMGRVGASFRGGFYCSGIPVDEGQGRTITTCEDIFRDLGRKFPGVSMWVYNDTCPPSPGCSFPANPPLPPAGKNAFCDSCVRVWQYVRSPRSKEFAARCPGYAPDRNCYAPGDTAHGWHLDVNTATSPDPSNGRE